MAGDRMANPKNKNFVRWGIWYARQRTIDFMDTLFLWAIPFRMQSAWRCCQYYPRFFCAPFARCRLRQYAVFCRFRENRFWSQKFLCPHQIHSAELEAELDSLNIFYQQYKKDYQYNLNQKKNEIAELQKEIREKESERDQTQEDLERYLLSGDDGLEQLEAELRVAILKMDAAIADLQQQLDWLTEEKKQLEDDFAVAEQNYLTYKGYLQTQLKSLK